MNKIYKVIWSKAKHTYVVASEIAKGHTKGETTGRGLKKLAAAMLVAAALLSPSFAWAADTVKVEPATDTASTTAVEVYTKEWAEKEISTLSTQIGTNATNIDTNTTNINGLTTRVNALESSKTDTALHISSSGDLIVGTKENQTVKDMEIRGKLTSGSISTGDITSTGDVTVAGKMAADGVTDETTKDGTYIKQNNTVGKNLGNLDTQVKANADAVSKLDTRITNVKEYVLSETNKNYVSKTDAAVQDGAIVKAANTIGENVTNLDAALAKETAARIGADKAQDAVIQQVNQNAANGIATLATAYNNEVASREAADNELNERITNEANAIHETTNKLQDDLNTETTAREAADTALDTRITNVKEYLENQTSENYVSKTDAAVQDGAIVKADKTIGENVTNLDAALAKETAARIGADKAQDKVIETVNQNMVDGFNTINKNMADGFTTLNQADANEAAAREAADTILDDKITAETSARVVADTKLVEATNGGLSLDNDNVLQKTKTEISSTGEVTTSKDAATTLILNKGAANQVKIDSEGVTVGTSSTQMDAEGFTAGGHDYDKAGAALMSDGRIKGANGDFTVDTDGNVASGNVTSTGTVKGKTLTDGAGASMSGGTVTGTTLTDGKATISNGNIKTNGGFIQTGGGNVNTQGGEVRTNGGKVATSGGEINTGSGAIKTVGGDILTAGGKLNTSGGDIVAGTGNISGQNITASGVLSGDSLTVANGMTGRSLTLTGGDLDAGAGTIKTTGEVDAGTLNVSGKATVKDLEVKGEFNAKTLSSKLDENNYTTINGGKTESMNLKMDKKTGEIQASASTFDETGSNAWARDDDSKGLSTVTADSVKQSISDVGDNAKNYASRELSQNPDNKYEITDSVVEGNQSNVENRTADTTDSQISFKDDSGKVLNKSYITQNLKKVLMGVEEGDNKTTIEQDANNIINTAKNGTIKNDAKDLVNTATGNMTNTVGGKLLNDVTGDMENKVGGNLTTTVGGSQTTTVTGDSSLTAENINNTATNKITNKALDVETEAKSSIMNKVSNDAGSNTSTQLSYQTKEEMSQADGKTASYLRGAVEEKSQLIDGSKKTTIDTVAGQTNTNITEGTNVSNSLQKADQIASSVTDGTNTTVVNQDAKSLASSITDGTKANNTNSTVDKSEQLIKASDTQYSATTKTATKMEDALVSGSSIIDVIKGLDAAGSPLISSVVTDGTNSTGVTQTAKDITNTAEKGTIANNAKDITNNATENMTNTVGKDLTTTVGGNQTTTVTGDSSLTAKNISNTATVKLSNSAADIENTATNSITDKVGKNTSWKMTDGTVVESVKDASGKTNQTTTTAADTYQFVKDGDNTLAKRTSSTNDNLNITDSNNTYTKITTATGNKQTVTDGMETASTNLTKSASNTLIENETQSVLDHMAADTSYTVMNENGNGSRRQQTASEILDRVTDGKNTSEVKMTANGITNTAEGGTIYNKSKDILNEASGDILNFADGEIGNVATKITNITGDNTVTSDTNGTTFENKAYNKAIEEGSVTKTTISGNTLETGKATMDYAEVMKDLGVRGNATVDGNTTLGTDGNDTLTVNSTSTFKEKVTMENDLNVKREVLVNEGDKNQVRINTNGITVGLNSTVVDSEGVYVGGHTFEAAKAGMDKDGKLKAASGKFQVDTEGNVSAVSYTVKDTNIKIDNTGINAGGTKVTGLDPADISHAGSTDAVSGGQLYETNTRVSGLETRMGTVETRVDKLDNKIDKVGANAAAMANLHPLEFDEDSKWNVAAAVGSSGSETASAVGVFYRPNENVMVNASAAMGTGENMFGGGVSLRLGHGGNKAKEAQMKAAAAENKELRAKVDDLTARMDALLSVLNPNMSKDFPDVPENHWAYEAVSRLAGNGIVEGYEDGKYHGERQMTRYEMAEIIYNALSKGAKAEKKLVEEFRPELQAMAVQKKA